MAAPPATRAKLQPLAAVRTLTPHPTHPLASPAARCSARWHHSRRASRSCACRWQRMSCRWARYDLLSRAGGLSNEGEMKEGGEPAALRCENRGGKSATAVPQQCLQQRPWPTACPAGALLYQVCTSSTRAGMLPCSWPWASHPSQALKTPRPAVPGAPITLLNPPCLECPGSLSCAGSCCTVFLTPSFSFSLSTSPSPPQKNHLAVHARAGGLRTSSCPCAGHVSHVPAGLQHRARGRSP